MQGIYLATVLLERNRWGTRAPSMRPSQWIARIRDAGFDGLELWEHHILGVEGEREAIAASGFPVPVYNTYMLFEDETQERYDQAASAIRALGCRGVKFNVGAGDDAPKKAREGLLRFADLLPEGCRLLCECHAGTPLEDAETAAAFLNSLPADRFGVVFHAIGEPEEIRRRARILDGLLYHAHVQLRTADKAPGGRLERCVEALRGEGYDGSWSIEFTDSSYSGDPVREDLEENFQNASQDLEALRALLR